MDQTVESGAPEGQTKGRDSSKPAREFQSNIPALELPKSGGAIRSIGEKFSVNPATGSGNLSVPVAMVPMRGAPELSLSYSSGSGNGPFGLGWSLGSAQISRKTEKSLPTYNDHEDTFVLAGLEDLVVVGRSFDGTNEITTYSPRTEGAFSWIRCFRAGSQSWWEVVSKDNVRRWFGKYADDDAPHSSLLVQDPERSDRVFSWLLAEERDDRGNRTRFEYKAEDVSGCSPLDPSEANRTVLQSYRYLKRILYAPTPVGSSEEWAGEIVLDYGEHTGGDPYLESQSWTKREDTFSSFRSGFEVRQRRLCRRILQFNLMPDSGRSGKILNCVTELDFDPSPIASRLMKIRHLRYEWDGATYQFEAMPEVSFAYSEATPDDTAHSLASEARSGTPAGLTSGHRFIDLDGRGVPGILSEQIGNWYYRKNLGSGEFQHPKALRKPAGFTQLSGTGQITTLDNDGQPFLASYGALAGYAERIPEQDDWEDFRPFPKLPNISFDDPNVRWLDLNGDGRPEICLLNDEVLSWWDNEGTGGIGERTDCPLGIDDNVGPGQAFLSNLEGIYTADFSGDGLSDIVRIRNGEVSYWPNLGYGRFGRKVEMKDAPHFAPIGEFDPNRLLLGDIDGSGTTDFLYLGDGVAHFWLNQSGNGWSNEQRLTSLPHFHQMIDVSLVDLLGNGTSALVWSSTAPGDTSDPWRYISLMVETDWTQVDLSANSISHSALAGVPVSSDKLADLSGLDSLVKQQLVDLGLNPQRPAKPYLLREMDNGMGATTRLSYTPSTQFFLEDEARGEPWLTRLHFPVHVVSRQEVIDHVTGDSYVRRSSYHHGYYDRSEQQFNGFGRVDSWDMERAQSKDSILFERTPVMTRQWFHTGAHLEQLGTSKLFADEYFPTQFSLPDSVIDHATTLSASEIREAKSVLRGLPLRSEIYACEALDEYETKPRTAGSPYSVSENRFRIRVAGLPDENGKRRVFQSVPEESLAQHFEQKTDDPRIAHEMTLKVDAFGAPEMSATIAYGRIEPDPDNHIHFEPQTATKIVVEQTARIDRTHEEGCHRIGLPKSVLSWECGSEHSLGDGLLRPDQLLDLFDPMPLPETDKRKILQDGEIRLLSVAFQLYRGNSDLGLNAQPLDLGEIDTLALPGRSYSLVFSPADVDDSDGNFSDTDFAEGKYEDPAGLTSLTALQVFLDTLPETSGTGLSRATGWWARDYEAELDPALFYSPIRARNPWGAESSMVMDDLALAVTSTTAHLTQADLITTAEIDYRLMQPKRVTEPNGTVQEARFDRLGRPIQVAVLGPDGEGDALDALEAFDASSTASSWMAYQFYEQPGRPGWVHSWSRETHPDDLNPGEESRWMEARTYSDGFGREILSKAKSAPGEYDFDADGVAGGGAADPRWVGSGRTIFDNKGNPVRQYEPYFTNSVEYGDGAVQHGVSPTIHYDPLDRAVRTEMPDGTETRVEFTPWEQRSFDAFDTFDPLNAPSYDAIAPEHLNTPTVEHLDSLGRPFLTEVTNFDPNTGVTETYVSSVVMDIAGNALKVFDAKGQLALEERFDRAGRPIRSASNDAGTSYALTAMDGQPRIGILANGHRIEQLYDAMRRPTELWVTEPDGTRYLREATVYADDPAFPGTKGKGRVWRVLDPCGLVETPDYDFKGLPVAATRHVLGTLMQANSPPPDRMDWSQYDLTSDLSLLWGESFTTHAQVDALGRPVVATAPDGSEQHFSYDAGGAMLSTTLENAPGIGTQQIVTGVDYDSKGRRASITYGNGTETTYSYDPLTFRLTRLTTIRVASGEVLQDMAYRYDPLGNIVEITDEAQDAIISGNQTLHPKRKYSYDSIARLVRATGREHIAQVHAEQRNAPTGLELPSVNDTAGVKAYAETWLYDAIGNIAECEHSGGTSAQNWKRLYHYDQPGRNELSRTEIVDSGSVTAYTHDQAGNITDFGGHLTDSRWNADDQPEWMKLGTVEAHYRYDAAGERLLKRVEKGGVTEVRLYLGGYEVFRKFSGSGALQKRQDSLHVMDGESRVLLIETEKLNDDVAQAGVVAQRWQLSDHLGTCALELDETGSLLSYEEMHAYGTTAWHWRTSGVSHKRHRYTGMERDEESGLQYHSARYYLPWLGRWLSTDPLGMVDGAGLWSYVGGRPVAASDQCGEQAKVDVDRNENEILSNRDYQKEFTRTESAIIDAEVGRLGHTVFERVMKQRHFDDDWYFEYTYLTSKGQAFRPDAMRISTPNVGQVWELKRSSYKYYSDGLNLKRFNANWQLENYRKTLEVRRFGGVENWVLGSGENDDLPKPFGQNEIVSGYGTLKSTGQKYRFVYHLGSPNSPDGPQSGMIFYDSYKIDSEDDDEKIPKYYPPLNWTIYEDFTDDHDNKIDDIDSRHRIPEYKPIEHDPEEYRPAAYQPQFDLEKFLFGVLVVVAIIAFIFVGPVVAAAFAAAAATVPIMPNISPLSPSHPGKI